MRDDFAIPNMGEAPQNYDKGHINRVVRNVEMTFRTAKSKGPASFTDITAESATIANLNATASTIYKITVPREGSEAVQFFEVGLSASAGHTFTGYSDTANAKPFLFNSTTNASNTVPSGGATGFIFRTLGVDRFSIIESTGVTGGISTNGTTISKNVANQGLVISGGNTAGNGANIELYGGSHATDANKAFYDADMHTFRNQASNLGRMRIESAGTIFSDNTGIDCLAIANNGNGAIEIGKQNGTTSTPFIDFHSSATVADYNARIVGSGGTGTAGSGTLAFVADDVYLERGKLRFPAAQLASSNANVLDDYEEGTWTPIVSFGFGTTGITYSIQGGYYVKVGQMVLIQLRTIFTAKGSSTGNARISGLPFNCTSVTGQAYTPVTWGYYAGFTALPTPTGYIETGNADINLMFHGATAVGAISDASFTNTSDMIITAVYRASA